MRSRKIWNLADTNYFRRALGSEKSRPSESTRQRANDWGQPTNAAKDRPSGTRTLCTRSSRISICNTLNNLRNCGRPLSCQLAARPARLSRSMANKKMAECSVRRTQVPLGHSCFCRILTGSTLESGSPRLSGLTIFSRMSQSNYGFSEFLTATRPNSEIEVTTIRNSNIAFSDRNITRLVAVRQVCAKILTSPPNSAALRARVAVVAPLFQPSSVGEVCGTAGC
jgi:hypothetical protein